MNLIEIADDLKNLPDQYLMQEIQAPSGNFPTYLVVTELGRRKRMRDKVAKDMPTQTVAEELATPPQPQMPPQMPPQAGLMAMPQAQTELAAQDAMGTTPPEMMMPTQQMAGGGMVSFKQGGDVIRAFNGLPEEMFEYVPRSSLDPYVAPGTPLPNTVAGLRRLGEIFPTTGRLFGMGEDRLYIDPVTQKPITYQEFLSKYPQSAAETRRLQRAASMPAAVAPVAAQAAPTSAPGGVPAPGGAPAPSGAPSAAPAPRAAPVQPSAGIRDALTPYALSTIGAQAASDYAQANPDRLTPFLQEAITKREGEIAGRRDSNINEALIQAGLGMMGSKSPYFLQGVSEGGLSGLKAYREGAKDLRQSEDALLASRAKMVEAQMLMDERKFKAASDARKEAIELDKLAADRANTQSAIDLRNLQASKIPAEIRLLEAQAEYARSGGRTAAGDTKAADDYAQRTLTMSGILPNNPKYISEYARLRNEYLTSIAGGVTQIPVAPAGGAGGARFVGFE